MKFLNAIAEWWKGHKTDAEMADTWIHKYAFQLVIVLFILLCLSTCSNIKHSLFSDGEHTNTHDRRTSSETALYTLSPHPEEERFAYLMEREDGGVAYYVELEDAGITQLVRGSEIIGQVWNDPANFQTIVAVGDVYVGVKANGKKQSGR